jgi:cytochrome c1
VPGVVGSDVQVGPPLLELWRRERIAGDLPNTAENLARWIREPQRLRPGSAMPDLGVSEAHAGRIAAYLLDPRR